MPFSDATKLVCRTCSSGYAHGPLYRGCPRCDGTLFVSVPPEPVAESYRRLCEWPAVAVAELAIPGLKSATSLGEGQTPMAEAVQSGRLGEVVHVAVHRNTSIADTEQLRGRTSIVDYLGIHDIDVLEWVTGRRVVEVAAKAASLRMRKFGADDAVQALMCLDNGAIGTLECSWLRPNEADSQWGSGMAIWATDGALRVTPYAAGLTVAAEGRSAWSNQVYLTESTSGSPLGGLYRDELANFVAFVRGDDTPACSGIEGLRAVQVAAAMKTSLSAHGQFVSL
jgi:predicted dehydrogenase